VSNQVGLEKVFEQAKKHYDAGRYTDAIAAYEQLLDANPRNATVLHLKGLAQYQSGDAASAAETLALALELDASNANHHSNYGAVLAALGKTGAAVQALEKAVELDPKNIESLVNLSALLQRQGKLDDAKAAIDKALSIAPDDPSALNNLGAVYRDLGDFSAAEEAYLKAVSAGEELIEPRINYANLLMSLARNDEALKQAKTAVDLAPNHPDTLNVLGLVYQKTNQLSRAEDAFVKAVEAAPRHAQALNNLGVVYKQMGRIEDAGRCFIDAHKAGGASPEVNTNLAEIMLSMGKTSDALATIQQAVTLNPVYAHGWQVYGDILMAAGMLGEAIAAWEKVAALNPNAVGAIYSIGKACAKAGEIEMALPYFKNAVAKAPDSLTAQSRTLYALEHSPEIDDQSLFEAYQELGQRFSPVGNKPAINQPDPRRPLKVGFVLPNDPHYRLPFKPKLWERNGWTLLFYTPENIGSLSDEEAAKKISSDGIDVLVDLAGHDRENRLGIFTHQPAPLQVSWTPYPGTIGLKSIAYRIGPSDDRFYTEKLVALDGEGLCYCAPDNPPEPSPPPVTAQGFFTFGYFDNTDKLTHDTLQVWADILKVTPNAKLLISTPEIAVKHIEERITGTLARLGIEADRITYGSGGQLDAVLKSYSAVDLVLDPTPYSCHITTFDALYMGVPVLTWKGTRRASATTATILEAIGHPELIADDKESYILKASELAKAPDRLHSYRTSLRQALMASPVIDSKNFADKFEKSLRTLWQQACEP